MAGSRPAGLQKTTVLSFSESGLVRQRAATISNSLHWPVSSVPSRRATSPPAGTVKGLPSPIVDGKSSRALRLSSWATPRYSFLEARWRPAGQRGSFPRWSSKSPPAGLWRSLQVFAERPVSRRGSTALLIPVLGANVTGQNGDAKEVPTLQHSFVPVVRRQLGPTPVLRSGQDQIEGQEGLGGQLEGNG